MYRYRTILSLFLFFLLSCGEKKQNSSTERPNEFRDFIKSENENDGFHGTLVIGSKDSIFYQDALGIADRNWNVPMTDSTRLDIASLNKSFQAALVLKAEEEGLLSVHDKLASFFPDKGFGPEITLHQLLTHTSGLADYDGVEESLKLNNFRGLKRSSFTHDEYVDFISKLKPFAAPGERFHYSNFGYHLLALILEDVYRKPFPEILNEKICVPFGLKNTYSETDNRIVHEHTAEGYSYNPKDSAFLRNEYIDLSLGRRIFSTAEDLYKWSKLLMSGELISDSSYQKMTTNHLKGIEENLSYGYGFVVFDGGDYSFGKISCDKPYVIHGGSTGGYKSILVNVSDGELIVALLSNVGEMTNELALADSLVRMAGY